jgi:serine/threonine protein kinase
MSPADSVQDRYELGRRIGHGGMATVYLARDAQLDRPVAVKLLADNLSADREFRRRFEREARLAARLDHPNVVQVFDVGEDDDGRPFMVMEYVEGGTVGDIVRRRRPSPERALRLLSQACAGVAHAHRAGLVHRDVKPHNLLVRFSDDRLKVTDFGIARAAEETGLTRPTRGVLGTKPYMAPEQLEGGRVTPATDVYALGVVMRELLGERTPGELGAIIRRSLEPAPRDRFADAAELGEAIDELRPGRTRPIRGVRRPAPGADGGAGRGPASAPATARAARPTVRQPRTAPTRRLARGGGWRAPAIALATVLALIGVVLAIASGGSQPTNPARGGAGGKAKVSPAPRLADPARQARALADWLRSESR